MSREMKVVPVPSMAIVLVGVGALALAGWFAVSRTLVVEEPALSGDARAAAQQAAEPVAGEGIAGRSRFDVNTHLEAEPESEALAGRGRFDVSVEPGAGVPLAGEPEAGAPETPEQGGYLSLGQYQALVGHGRFDVGAPLLVEPGSGALIGRGRFDVETD